MVGGGAVRWMERHQVALYIGALGVGAAVGLAVPAVAGVLEGAITPVLGLLLFATFVGVPLVRLPGAFRDVRFLGVVLLLNFVAVPAVAFGLSRFVADDRALLVGVLLVLLAPCVDYVVVFTGLAGGARERLLAATPVLMVVQLALLPVLLLLFAGRDAVSVIDPAPLVTSFGVLILAPLALAALVQWVAAGGGRMRRGAAGGGSGAVTRGGGAARRAGVARGVERVFGAAMVPLLMATLAVVVASQVAAVGEELGALVRVVPLYVAFAVALPVIGASVARAARLDVGARRAGGVQRSDAEFAGGASAGAVGGQHVAARSAGRGHADAGRAGGDGGAGRHRAATRSRPRSRPRSTLTVEAVPVRALREEAVNWELAPLPEMRRSA